MVSEMQFIQISESKKVTPGSRLKFYKCLFRLSSEADLVPRDIFLFLFYKSTNERETEYLSFFVSVYQCFYSN